MALDNLLRQFSDVQSNVIFGSLLSVELTNYIVSCKVEGKSERTIQGYAEVIAGLDKTLARLGVKSLPAINEYHIRLYLLSVQERVWRGKKVQLSTVHIHYRALKTFFFWLVREEIIKTNPVLKIKPPKVAQKVIDPLTPDDINDVLLGCSQNIYTDVRNRAMVLTLLDTGLRREELTNIKLEHIDIKAGIIKVLGKGNKERKVPISKKTKAAIVEYLQFRARKGFNGEWLWYSEEGTPLTLKGVQSIVIKLLRRCGIVHGGPHRFRHTCAVMFLRNGGSEFALQSLLGHSTLEMTKRYARTFGTDDMIQQHKTASPVESLLK